MQQMCLIRENGCCFGFQINIELNFPLLTSVYPTVKNLSLNIL
jgi:hypothetical protein